MATTSDFKNGLVLNLDGQLWTITEFQHVKPGKGGAFVRTTLKNVLSGKVVDKTFNAGIKVETATVDKRDMTYLYKDGTDFVFMDGDTYDQIHVPAQTVGLGGRLPAGEHRGDGRVHDGVPLYVELPVTVELVVQHTDPGLQGDRSTGGTKPATLETGAADRTCRCSSTPATSSRSTPATAGTSAASTDCAPRHRRSADGRPHQGPQARRRRPLRGRRSRGRDRWTCCAERIDRTRTPPVARPHRAPGRGRRRARRPDRRADRHPRARLVAGPAARVDRAILRIARLRAALPTTCRPRWWSTRRWSWRRRCPPTIPRLRQRRPRPDRDDHAAATRRLSAGPAGQTSLGRRSNQGTGRRFDRGMPGAYELSATRRARYRPAGRPTRPAGR